MKAARHMGGKGMARKAGGGVKEEIDEGREKDTEDKEMEGRKAGGRVKRKDGGAAEGMMAKKRYDRPGRKAGGGVGSDKRPLTSAANSKPADGRAGGVGETAPE